MNNWKAWLDNIQAKPFSALGLLVLLAIPVTLLLVFRSQDTRSSAAAPDALEAENGVLSDTGVSIKSGNDVSGGSYIEFNTPIASISPAPTIQAFEQSSNYISMEAENYMTKNQNGSSYDWNTITNGPYPEFSNIDIKYISARPNDNNITYFPNNISSSPEVAYNIKFNETGTFYVWLRSSGPNTNSDSAHVGFNGQIIGTMALYYKGENGDTADWKWKNRENASNNNTRVKIDVTQDMVDQVHTFQIWMRETGTSVDRINLTKDSTWQGGTNSTNRGPAESTINPFPSN